jgi:RND family efflux transporter MFP subunit
MPKIFESFSTSALACNRKQPVVRVRWILAAQLLLLLALLTGCEQKNTYVEPPPPMVTVSKPIKKTVTDYLEFTGTTASVGSVEVRARVQGILESMHFEPGTKVRKNQLLFVIDPKPYEAQLAVAKGDLAKAKAKLDKSESNYWRLAEAGKKGAVAEVEVVAARANRDADKAGVEAAKAVVEEAALQLSYTRVTAPIGGRAGRNLVDIGNFVGRGDATVLTTITQYDPMYAYFHLNERDLLRVMTVYREKVKEKGLDPARNPNSEADIPVFLGLVNEQGYPHRGILDFAESGVDTATGTIELRAIFPNPQKPAVLVPGLFARLRFPVGIHADALLVSERALGADQQGNYLLVINSDNVVEKRLVSAGQVIDGLRVIDKGIQAEDRVIVQGLQRARPGGKVAPKEVPMQSTSTLEDQTGEMEDRLVPDE